VRLCFLAFAGFVLVSTVEANPCIEDLPKSYGHVVVDAIVGVYDGDTFTVRIEEWPPIIGEAISVRVSGVDTPEIRGQCPAEKRLAKKARAFTRDVVTGARQVELRNLRRDKYFRLLADVCVDGRALSTWLVEEGLGYPYEGDTKRSWCK
jgi:endonuclease YncB( thermonuclease family)